MKRRDHNKDFKEVLNLVKKGYKTYKATKVVGVRSGGFYKRMTPIQLQKLRHAAALHKNGTVPAVLRATREEYRHEVSFYMDDIMGAVKPCPSEILPNIPFGTNNLISCK